MTKENSSKLKHFAIISVIPILVFLILPSHTSSEAQFLGEEELTYNLFEGSNMISVISETNVDRILSQDECKFEGSIKKYDYEKEDYVEEKDTLKPGVAYWVHTSNGCKFKLSNEMNVPEKIQLREGWNFVSAIGNAEELADTCDKIPEKEGNHVIAKWNGFGTVPAENMKPTRGYMIYAQDECEMNYSTVELSEMQKDDLYGIAPFAKDWFKISFLKSIFSFA